MMRVLRNAGIVLLATVSVLSRPAVAQTADLAALMAPVSAWTAAFNAGQTNFPSAAFTDDCTVIDEFPPFAWSTTRQDVHRWYALLVGSQSPERRSRFLAAKEHLTLDAPRFVQQRGDGAYMVFESTLTYVAKGAAHTQRGRFVVAERMVGARWKIAAHSWAIESDV